MRRKVLPLLLTLVLCLSLATPAFAASDDAVAAANSLYELGLFKGVGTNPDGTPNFDLDRAPTRYEAVTMLVRLLGMEEAANAKGWYTYTPNPDKASWAFGVGADIMDKWKEQRGNWITPLADVTDWAKPYVGYAYVNGLTSGVSPIAFDGSNTVSATQYLTFILRALGYVSGTDFQWDKAWEITDKLGITAGQYNASSDFTRGDAAIVSNNALSAHLKGTTITLYDSIFNPGGQEETVELTGKLSFMLNSASPALVTVSVQNLEQGTIMIDGQQVVLGEHMSFNVYGYQNWTETQWTELYDPFASLKSVTTTHSRVLITGIMHKDADGFSVIEILSIKSV